MNKGWDFLQRADLVRFQMRTLRIVGVIYTSGGPGLSAQIIQVFNINSALQTTINSGNGSGVKYTATKKKLRAFVLC